jgi:hypothetical protein
VVIEDKDNPPGYGAFWGEVETEAAQFGQRFDTSAGARRRRHVIDATISIRLQTVGG